MFHALPIAELLSQADWGVPPESMEFSEKYEDLLNSIQDLASSLGGGRASTGRTSAELGEKAQSLYLKAPGIANVMLNYKICVEHDLPLHPTVYYELKEARKYKIEHDIGEIDAANSLFRESIELAKKSLLSAPNFGHELGSFKSRLPRELLSFIYTAVKDAYTWRASNPDLIFRLAHMIEPYSPELIVAAAHGSIMSAVLLADFLELPLYLIRFSMFKRHDEAPIVTLSDEAWLYEYRDAPVILYDEDVAGGNTLEKFSAALGRILRNSRTACSIRHGGASFKPDYSARVWWE